MNKNSLILLLITILSFACEKDDICPEATATTPQLIVRFYDAVTSENLKSVSGLFVYGINDNSETVFFKSMSIKTTDSIALTLRTDSNITKFVFHKDLVETSDLLVGNPDTVDVNYIKDNIYVSRACGYKATFTNLGATPLADADNWISSINIIAENNTINNENAAHINIYH